MPDLHQWLVDTVLDPLDLWRVGEYATRRYQREFARTQFLSADELQTLQLQRFQNLLARAYDDCPYYRQLLDGADFRPEDLRSLDDVARIPILEKSHIQQHRDQMVSQRVPASSRIANQTGGSTGSPISFFLDIDRHCSREAAARRHNAWAGWRVGDKVAHVWGASPDLPPDMLKARLRNLLLDRSLILDTAAVTKPEMEQFFHRFNQFRPKIIHAYARSLALVTRYLRDNGFQLQHHPSGIVTSAEVLSDEDRKLLEDYYQCPVFNRYGCREVSVIASECEHHDGLHVMAEGLYVEIVNGDRPAAEGEIGSVVVTDLMNHTMPLIRYRIGDVSSLNTSPCKCGRALPRLNAVQGRVTDFLVSADGTLVSGVFLATYVLAERPSLGQVQILQQRQGQVLFRFTGTGQSNLDEDLSFLREAVQRYLGFETQMEHEVVDEIPLAASGKFTFCRSEVAPELLLSS